MDDRRSPYQGLLPYSEEDARYFFGRDEWIDIVTDNLLAYRLTLLYGPSGVGKSSLLHAGVAYRLHHPGLSGRSMPYPRVPVLVYDSWVEDPVAGLAAALREQCEGGPDGEHGRDALAALVIRWADVADSPVLLILDQFEEYFVYHRGRDDSESFADQLAGILSSRDVPANVLVSLREDALSRLDVFDGHVPGLFDTLLRVGHLDRDAAREAIERPVERWNEDGHAGEQPLSLDPALADAVLAQVQAGRVRVGRVGRGSVGSPAEDLVEAPHLQLVMSRIFAEERRRGSARLQARTLDELGGAERIVHRHLDDTMAALPPRDRKLATRLFDYLVTPGGTKIALPPAALASWTKTSETEVTAVLDRLARGEHRILRSVESDGQPDGSTAYEIFHDRLAPAILDYATRRQHARRRRTVRLLAAAFGAVALIALLVVAALSARLDATRADLAQVVNARILSVELLAQSVSLGEYLQDIRQPLRGLSARQQEQPGFVFDVRMRLQGFQDQQITLRWQMRDAATGARIRGPAFAQAAATFSFTAQAQDQSRTWASWVPHLGQDRAVRVRFQLIDSGGQLLDQRDSEPVTAS